MEPNLVNQSVPQIPQPSVFKLAVGLLLAFLLGGTVVYLWQNPQFLNSLPFMPQPKSCTLDAKICPDGTSVGRQPPDCEFAPCPPEGSSSQPSLIPPEPVPENAVPGLDSSESSSVPADWKTYRLRKSYKNSSVKFEIRYPKEWQISKEEGELMGGRVIWYIQDPDKYTFSVSWLNPDMIYSLAVDVCPSMCNKFSEVNTQEGVKIEILKPTPEGRKQFNLSDNYLIAFHPYNLIQNGVPTLEFSTTSLDSKTFSQILSTFRFTD